MKKKKILIVEDEFITAEDLATSLEELGYEVADIATDGLSAINSYETLKPDLIMMDIKIKGELNGIQTAAKIKSMYNVPVVFLTANSNTKVLAEAKLVGPHGYLLKPFNNSELHATLETAFYKHELEAQLVDSERMFRSFTESSPIGILIHNGKNWIYANPEAENITGYCKEELLKMAPAENAAKEYRKIVRENIKSRLEGDWPVDNYEIKLLRKDKTKCWAYLRVAKINYRGSSAFLVTIIDITDRKKAEEEVKIQKTYFEYLFEISPDAIVTLDRNDVIKTTNSRFQEIFGYTKEEAVGRKINDLIVPDGHKDEAYVATLKVAQGEEIRFECVRKTKNGKLLDMAVIGKPIVLEGESFTVYGIYRDISKRKAAERALSESEQKYRRIFEDFQDLYFLMDLKQQLLEVSPSIKRILGYERDEVIGQSASNMYAHKDMAKKFMVSIREKKHVNGFEADIIRKDGAVLNVSINAHLVFDEVGNAVLIEGTVHDITERIQTEAKLKESEEKYRLIVENSGDAILINQGGFLKYVNQSFLTLVGYKFNEVINASYKKVFSGKGMEILKARENRRLSGYETEARYETELLHKDGSTIPVEVTVAVIKYQGEDATFAFLRDITAQKQLIETLQKQEATHGLEGLIPICASCRKIKESEGKVDTWVLPEVYISDRIPDVKFSHGICPECMEKLYPQIYNKLEKKDL